MNGANESPESSDRGRVQHTATLSYRVGRLHLGLAGAGNAAVGTALLGLAVADQPFGVLVALGQRISADGALLDAGPKLGLAARLVPVVGLLALSVGGLQLWTAARLSRPVSGRTVVVAVLGAFDPVVAPLSLVAGTLLWFDGDTERVTRNAGGKDSAATGENGGDG